MGGDFKPTLAHTPPAPKGVQRHAHASDVQDILPGKAPSGNETTEHPKKRRRRPGPKRKNWMPNPFGKYPTSSAVKKYLEATKKYYAPSTQKERSRKTRYLTRMLTTELNGPNSPREVKEKDVIAYLDWMEDKNMSNATQRRMIRYLRDYLAFYGNDVVSKMVSRRMIRVPKEVPAEVRSLSKETVDYIHSMAANMNGWKGVVARFITIAYPYTGLRPSELRTLKYKDVDQATWTLRVSHPKGEGIYGVNRRVGILPQARMAFKEFLMERKAFLEEHGQTANFEALIPHKGKKGIDYWGAQQLNNLKTEIEKMCGLNFKLKDYRSTFCQLAIDLGANLQAVSKVMGHKTTVTTETYYGRIRDDTAISEIERAFSEPDAQTLIHPELKLSQ